MCALICKSVDKKILAVCTNAALHKYDCIDKPKAKLDLYHQRRKFTATDLPNKAFSTSYNMCLDDAYSLAFT